MSQEQPWDNYRQAGFGQDLSFGNRPALLIVDFVQAYLEPTSPLYAGVEEVRDRCMDLLAAARDARMPIFHTNVIYEPGSADGGLFKKKLPLLRVFERGSPLGDFASGLEPAPGETVITKQYASAYFATPLAASLTALGVDTVLIGGVTTSGCIRASALDTLQHGFVPIVVRDAVGDRDSRPHEANLFDLQAKYAEVVSLPMATDYVRQYRGQAGGPPGADARPKGR